MQTLWAKRPQAQQLNNHQHAQISSKCQRFMYTEFPEVASTLDLVRKPGMSSKVENFRAFVGANLDL